MNGKNIIGDLMKLDKNTRLCIFGGLAIGFLNGLLGAGGGIVAVPILHKIINNRKDAHINSIAVILPLCIISAVIYLMNGNTLGEIKIIPLRAYPLPDKNSAGLLYWASDFTTCRAVSGPLGELSRPAA